MSERPPSPSRARWRPTLRLLLKVSVTTGIFYLLFRRIDLDVVWDTLGRAKPFWLAAAFAACSTAFVTSTLKWRALLRAMGAKGPPWPRLLHFYVIGHFVSSFLPGTVGGDVLRCRLAGPGAGGYLRAAASILAERLTGLVAMVALAVAAVAVDPQRLATTPVLIIVGGGAAGLVLGLAVASHRRFAVAVAYRMRHGRLRRVVLALFRLHLMLRRLPARAVAEALTWSGLFYLGSGLLFYCSCRAFDVPVSFVESASIVVVVCVLMLAPVSLGGLGLRQAGDVYMLGLVGVDPAQALVVSLLRQSVNYAYTLLGGVVFLLGKSNDGPAMVRDAASRTSLTDASSPLLASERLKAQGEDL